MRVHTITGPGPDAVNTFEDREAVATAIESHELGSGPAFTARVPALSVNAFIFEL